MKKFLLKELKEFLEISDIIDTPFKFYFLEEGIEAIIHMRTFLLAWKGEDGEDRIKILREHGFKEAKELETKRIVLEDLVI
jgi:hypothetical protein